MAGLFSGSKHYFGGVQRVQGAQVGVKPGMPPAGEAGRPPQPVLQEPAELRQCSQARWAAGGTWAEGGGVVFVPCREDGGLTGTVSALRFGGLNIKFSSGGDSRRLVPS